MTLHPTAQSFAAPDRAAPHALVLGAGFGGLAAALRLLARGFAVTVVDRLDQPGGRASVFREGGFVWDAGPTIITAPYILEELWALFGRRLADDVTLKRMEPFYRIRFHDGSTLDAWSDRERMRAAIAALSPVDAEAFDRYLADSEAIFKVAFEELVAQPFHTLKVLLRSAPDLIRLQGYRSVHGKVSDYFRDERIRIAFSYHPLLIGGNPMRTTAYYCLIAHLERLHGVHYVMGGTGALVAAMARLITDAGGTIRLRADVRRILVDGGRAAGVELADGSRIAADLVVSNADVAHTYGTLLKEHPRRRWTDRRLARADYSMGLFVWYFGLDRRYDAVPHHSIILGPRYAGLLKDIFERKVLTDDLSLYLHRPSASDPGVAPPGCDGGYVLAPVPHLDSGTDWATVAEPFRARIQQRLEDTVMPDMGRHIVASRVMTPADFATRLLAHKGAAFSLEPKLFQSAWFRPHNVSEELPGLYLVGAGTHPGAGVPGVISSAKVLDQVVPDPAQVMAQRG